MAKSKSSKSSTEIQVIPKGPDAEKHIITSDVKIIETDQYLDVKYSVGMHRFDLMYDKNKDLAMVIKNGVAADLKKLSIQETDCYHEALEMAITYHHDRDGCPTH